MNVERSAGARAPDLMAARMGHAEALLRLERPAEARPLLAQVLERRASDANDLGSARFLMAQALHAQGQSAQARGRLSAALQAYAQTLWPHPLHLAQAKAWQRYPPAPVVSR